MFSKQTCKTRYIVVLCLVAQSCLTLCGPVDYSPPSSSGHGDSPGKNTGVGCHALLPRIFPTQGLNPDLLHCRPILYHLSYQGSTRILEWIAYHFSRGSSQPRNRTQNSALQADSLPAELPGRPWDSYQHLSFPGDFPGGLAVGTQPANAGDTDSNPWCGKIPHAERQLSPCVTNIESPHCSNRAWVPRVCVLQHEKPP